MVQFGFLFPRFRVGRCFLSSLRCVLSQFFTITSLKSLSVAPLLPQLQHTSFGRPRKYPPPRQRHGRWTMARNHDRTPTIQFPIYGTVRGFASLELLHQRDRYLYGCCHRIARTTLVGASQEQYFVSGYLQCRTSRNWRRRPPCALFSRLWLAVIFFCCSLPVSCHADIHKRLCCVNASGSMSSRCDCVTRSVQRRRADTQAMSHPSLAFDESWNSGSLLEPPERATLRRVHTATRQGALMLSWVEFFRLASSRP